MQENKAKYELLASSVYRHINHDPKRYNELRHVGVHQKKKYS